MILIINKLNVVNGINNTNIVILPIIAPINILINLVFLLSNIEVVKRIIKSNAKLRNNIKSIYIFTLPPI